MLPALPLTSAAVEATLHSYDNGTASSVYVVDAHAITAAWTAGVTDGGEGNGFEGIRPPGAAALLTDPDSASGVAWDKSADAPNGANNAMPRVSTQPCYRRRK